jgi:hypothetical protein
MRVVCTFGSVDRLAFKLGGYVRAIMFILCR